MVGEKWKKVKGDDVTVATKNLGVFFFHNLEEEEEEEGGGIFGELLT